MRIAPFQSVYRLLLLMLMALAFGAAAADEPLSAEELARPPATDSIRFSPDGTRFAARVERKGQMVLVVVEYATNKGRVFNSDRGSDLATFRWLSNDLIVVSTTKLGVRTFDLSPSDFAPAYVSLDDKSRVDPATAARAIRRVGGTDADIIVARPPTEDYGSQVLEVVDSRSGQVRRKLTDEPPGPKISSWILDAELTPRAAIGYDIKSRQSQAWWRASKESNWRMLCAYDPRTGRGFYPVAFDADGELLVLSNLGTGRYALHKLDKDSANPGELLAGHPRVDITANDVIYGEEQHVPVGVAVRADRTRFYWFDSRRAQVQQTIDATLRDRVNTLQFLAEGRVLVRSSSDIEPAAYYFFEPATRSLTEWVRARPWLQAERMSRTDTFVYKTSDGHEIESYLTMPRRSTGSGPVPLLVWVHGGPAARDYWGFDPLVQFVASRGIAVLQPNFRGSTGFGIDFENAGHRQWGRRMQDDVTDGVRELVRQGRVDPQRICIGGASYGGYSALMGVIREPELFRCAIDMVGPTDLIRNVESAQADYNRRRGSYIDKEIEDLLKVRMGDPDDPADRRMMEENSPSRQAHRVKVPVLLVYGSDDRRVPLEHGTTMRDALRAAGASVEWRSYAGEGHGVWDRSNLVDLYRRIDQFLMGSMRSSSQGKPP
jgi:dipeptidyl aminopeptidase/acylaminoacyl peptidase